MLFITSIYNNQIKKIQLLKQQIWVTFNRINNKLLFNYFSFFHMTVKFAKHRKFQNKRILRS